MSERSPVNIVSERANINLREFTPDDAVDIFSLINANRAHLSQHGDTTSEKYTTLVAVQESIANPSDSSKIRLGIRNGEGVFIGSINLTPDENKSSEAEIGYYMGQEHGGRGYMAKAVIALTMHAFRELKYQRLTAQVHKNNTASGNVLLSAGYKYIGNEGDEAIFEAKRGEEIELPVVRSRWDGGYIKKTTDCESCPFYKVTDSIQLCTWGASWKELENKPRRKCAENKIFGKRQSRQRLTVHSDIISALGGR